MLHITQETIQNKTEFRRLVIGFGYWHLREYKIPIKLKKKIWRQKKAGRRKGSSVWENKDLDLKSKKRREIM